MELILFILIIILPLIADIFVRANYSINLKKENSKGMTGAEIARKILDKNGLSNIYVVATNGYLTDHYDPKRKVIRLSKDVYEGSSVSSMAIASHECGHAIQDKDGYFFLRFRNSIIPLVNIASYLGYVAILIGLFLSTFGLIWLGIIMEFVILFFQLITLPVEFNASSRALENLINLNIVSDQEMVYSKKMLFAAALTYVASVATAVLQIARLLLMVRRND